MLVAVIVATPPGHTVEGLAEQVTVGGSGAGAGGAAITGGIGAA
jgi:hypothetical protein